jgi:hypothetical protein
MPAKLGAVLVINFLPIRPPLLFASPMALLIVTLVAGLEGIALGLALADQFAKRRMPAATR